MTEALLSWFEQKKRALPWREARSPYRVWLAEVMLQQTQVVTVIPYFENYLKRFPSVQDLAKASLDELLKHWEGLGYYRRAKNMHKAAQVIAFDRAGQFPETYAGWLELPGIGPYSAAAIASISNGERVVAIDANVKRLAARLFMLDKLAEKSLRDYLSPFMSLDNPGAFNEALMELGATLCKKKPDCPNCPIQNYCLAFKAGKTADYPRVRLKTKRPHYQKFALIDLEDGQIWLRQRSADEMLNGLWGFVLLDECPDRSQGLAPVRHAYSHFSLEVTPIFGKAKNQPGQFVALAGLPELALSKLDYKILAAVQDWL